MRLQKVPFRSTGAFSEVFLKYIEQHRSVKSFFGHFPTLGNLAKQQKEKSRSFSGATRKLLVSALNQQYGSLVQSAPAVAKNIQLLLKENTFTVTTGHQLCLCTGPLYFIYKIVTVINTCRQLKKKYPKSNFVPVFWMASEDHDYEEIKSIRLYGKSFSWETHQQGAVGRFRTADLKQLLDELPGDVGVFREAYLKSKTLGEAARNYVNALFKEEGLVVIDGDDRELKKILQPVMLDDLTAHNPFNLVTETNRELAARGLPPTVNPREINFFYLDENVRSRIEQSEGGFKVVDTDLRFSEDELKSLVTKAPEKFSPNVILRPLFQEMILPNLAYVGGPAELVYWLELKKVFDHFKVPFPVLLPRNFALVVDAPSSRKMAKTKLKVSAFFQKKDDLYKQWVLRHSAHDLSLAKELKAQEQILTKIKARSASIDPTLAPMVAAQAEKIRKLIQTMERKMIRAEKRKQSDALRQIGSLKDSLFPNGGLQERTDNFLNFYQPDPHFIQSLLHHLDPLDFQFNVLSYHD